jgi:hypothetical protein
MLPPPGIAPTLAQDPSPTTALLASTIAAIGVTIPSPLSSVASSLGTAAALSSGLDQPSDIDNGECRLLGPFAIFVQGALGLLALLSLVYKRYRERPQRPLKIWFFDVSKQVVGSVLVHTANLLMSMLSSGQFNLKINPSSIEARAAIELVGRIVDSKGKYQPNPCSFYLLNLAIDVSTATTTNIFVDEVSANNFRIDNNRNSHLDLPTPNLYRTLSPYSFRLSP